MGDWVSAISIGTMIFGLFVCIGLFNRLGPVETERGMRRLGYVLIAIGVLIGMTQSTPM